MRIMPGLCLCVLLFSGGCGMELTKEEGDRRTASGVGGVALENPLETPATTPQPAAETQPAEPSATAPPAAATPTTETAATEPDVIREKAKVGAGKQGRYEGSGAVVTPIKAYFRTQQRLAFDVQIPQALQLFQATNGYYPRTQEEFDTQILAANNIKLPELPPGHKYVYDPKQHELMVEQPAK